MGDILHKIWAVNANWNAGNGWNVNANSVDNPNAWNESNQVLARNFLRSRTLLWGFCLFLPSAEHAPDFSEVLRKGDVFFIIQGFNFPSDLKEKF
ncbi:MAG: hypothetical protein UU70_C0036G0003 [Candidatus Yanofskybacteria bacterium GW2011_GWA1_41_6]|uniref:Uncharacterized protein n=1 Tax=Candidatus Yanofskybacteria bacterium GW2011_GWA1_41_6 TaxID=1619020 RepID=A0A0G0WII1_9BACT|nr:MAG: hypothetical protein UU70_C0036G0003 [Candidatus Yanofskybacteria bacterium GW2011_GWA1_41_6]